MQLGKIAQLRGYPSTQLVTPRPKRPEIRKVAQLRWYLADQGVLYKRQISEAGETSQIPRDVTCQLVRIEVQLIDIGPQAP